MNKLQTIRKQRGLSQSQLSLRAGIGIQNIQQYEQGRRDLSSARLSSLLKLCLALDCALTDILDEGPTLDLISVYNNRQRER